MRLNHEFHRGVNLAADSPKLAQLMSQITRYALESVFPRSRAGLDSPPVITGGCWRRCRSAMANRPVRHVATPVRRLEAARRPPAPHGVPRIGRSMASRADTKSHEKLQ